MPVRLFRDINIATNIITAYRERKASDEWAKWVQDNPERNELLERARIEAEHYGR